MVKPFLDIFIINIEEKLNIALEKLKDNVPPKLQDSVSFLSKIDGLPRNIQTTQSVLNGKLVRFLVQYRYFVLTSIDKSFDSENKKKTKSLKRFLFAVVPCLLTIPLIIVTQPELDTTGNKRQKSFHKNIILPLFNFIKYEISNQKFQLFIKTNNTDLVIKKLDIVVKVVRQLFSDRELYQIFEKKFLPLFHNSIDFNSKPDLVSLGRDTSLVCDFFIQGLAEFFDREEEETGCFDSGIDIIHQLPFFFARSNYPLYKNSTIPFTVSSKEFMHVIEYYLTKYDVSLSVFDNMCWTDKDVDYLCEYFTYNNRFYQSGIRSITYKPLTSLKYIKKVIFYRLSGYELLYNSAIRFEKSLFDAKQGIPSKGYKDFFRFSTLSSTDTSYPFRRTKISESFHRFNDDFLLPSIPLKGCASQKRESKGYIPLALFQQHLGYGENLRRLPVKKIRKQSLSFKNNKIFPLFQQKGDLVLGTLNEVSLISIVSLFSGVFFYAQGEGYIPSKGYVSLGRDSNKDICSNKGIRDPWFESDLSDESSLSFLRDKSDESYKSFLSFINIYLFLLIKALLGHQIWPVSDPNNSDDGDESDDDDENNSDESYKSFLSFIKNQLLKEFLGDQLSPVSDQNKSDESDESDDNDENKSDESDESDDNDESDESDENDENDESDLLFLSDEKKSNESDLSDENDENKNNENDKNDENRNDENDENESDFSFLNSQTYYFAPDENITEFSKIFQKIGNKIKKADQYHFEKAYKWYPILAKKEDEGFLTTTLYMVWEWEGIATFGQYFNWAFYELSEGYFNDLNDDNGISLDSLVTLADDNWTDKTPLATHILKFDQRLRNLIEVISSLKYYRYRYLKYSKFKRYFKKIQERKTTHPLSPLKVSDRKKLKNPNKINKTTLQLRKNTILLRQIYKNYKKYRTKARTLYFPFFITIYSVKLLVLWWLFNTLKLLKIIKWYFFVYRETRKVIVKRNNLLIKLQRANRKIYKKNITYVIIKDLKISFKHIVGVDTILPGLCKIVHILKDSPFNRKIKKKLGTRKGFLFVGPPGTGKTFLVKAIAGEAKVPVIVESASRVIHKKNNILAQKNFVPLVNTFKIAKKWAPCILFIDEIDTIGSSRPTVKHKFKTSLANEVFSLNNAKLRVLHKQKIQEIDTKKRSKPIRENNPDVELKENILKEVEIKNLSFKAYDALVQLLIEMDNLEEDAGVLVIGATNRPQVLDPALVRSKRFSNILKIGFPEKANRIEILKLYTKERREIKTKNNNEEVASLSLLSKKQIASHDKSFFYPLYSLFRQKRDTTSVSLSKDAQTKKGSKNPLNSKDSEIQSTLYYPLPQKSTEYKKTEKVTYPSLGSPNFSDFYWDYFGNLTLNFNAADLTTVISHSSYRALLQNTNHTIETIEEGIEYVATSIQNKKNEETTKVYYQAGKAFLHTLLPLHPSVNNVKKVLRQENFRMKRQSKFTTSFYSRSFLETRLIGFYAGTAAELLFLSLNYQTKKQNTNTNKIKQLAKKSISFQSLLSQTNIGVEDLATANSLASFLVENYQYYSNNIAIQAKNQIPTDHTKVEYRTKKTFHILPVFAKNIKKLVSGRSTTKNFKSSYSNLKQNQVWFFAPLWQNKVLFHSNSPLFWTGNNIRWFRIYISLNTTSEAYKEIEIIPDKFYHQKQAKKNWSNSKRGISFDTRNYSSVKLSNSCAEKETRNNDIQTRKSNYKKNNLFSFKKFTNRKAGLEKQKKGDIPKKGKEDSQEGSIPLQGIQGRRRLKGDKVLPKIFGKENDHQIKNQKVIYNDLYQLNTDYICHALIYTCFNQAFCLLDENREVLDYLVDYLLRFEILRQDKINEVFFCFGLPIWYKIETKSGIKNKETTYALQQKQKEYQLRETLLQEKLKNKKKINETFDKNWGKNSRRVFSRFFTFNQYPVSSRGTGSGVASFRGNIWYPVPHTPKGYGVRGSIFLEYGVVSFRGMK